MREMPGVAERSPQGARSAYDRLANSYDLLAQLYSLGAISRAKRAHLTLVEPGHEVLYAGAGCCQEGTQAARRGARVTLVDLSGGMLRRARELFTTQGLDAHFVHADVLDLSLAQRFDHVVAPFFLNVLSSLELERGLLSLAGLVKAGGLLSIADFRGPVAQPALRLVQRLHYLPPLLLFHFLTRNPWHELYDYRRRFLETGIRGELEHSQTVSVLGLPLYESLTFRCGSARAPARAAPSRRGSRVRSSSGGAGVSSYASGSRSVSPV